MTPRDFCYWLEGYLKNSDPDRPYKQIQDIKDNLDLVFNQREEDYNRNVPNGYYNTPRYSYNKPANLNPDTRGHDFIY